MIAEKEIIVREATNKDANGISKVLSVNKAW